MIHLGIDTSNYKTSMAAVDESGIVITNISEYLEVPAGKRGLRQSDAFFKHSNRLPIIIKKMSEIIDFNDVVSIGVSERPRRSEGSYMPCFLPGVNLAKTLSGVMKIPVYGFSHQEGHAAAVMENNGLLPKEPVLFMHLSGGTTEFLKCKPDARGYETEIIGGSLDISFGQLIDRFGVALGLSFPSGMYIDKFACSYEHTEGIAGILGRVAVNDGYFNLSGSETRLMEFALSFNEKYCKPEISEDFGECIYSEVAAASYELIDNIADILLRSADMLTAEHNIDKVYMAGGVASSDALRRIIEIRQDSVDYNIIFGDSKLSGDNAVGTALLARRIYGNK